MKKLLYSECIFLMPCFSFANSDRSGNPICSDVSQIQLDSSSIFWLTVMTSLTCCISIVVSPPCESSSFPAYHGLALVKTMPSSLVPLVCICLSHPWHLVLLRLGFSTKPQRQCLHFTRVCGLCHHPSLSNSGNVSGHHLAGSNKTSCWSSFVRFVASFSSVQFCHPCHLSSLVVSFDLDLKLKYAFESIPRLLWAHQPPCILQWFYKTPSHVMCVHR